MKHSTIAALFLAALLSSNGAHAQSGSMAASDAEWGAAVGFYIAAATLHVGGSIGFAVAFSSGPADDAAEKAAMATMSISILGLLAFVPAIFLHIDANVRRRNVQLGIAAIGSGAAFVMNGRF